MFHDYPGSSHVLNTKRIEYEISSQRLSDNVDVGMDMLLTSTTRGKLRLVSETVNKEINQADELAETMAALCGVYTKRIVRQTSKLRQ